MRLLTFSFLRNSKYKRVFNQLPKRLRSDHDQCGNNKLYTAATEDKFKGDPNYIDADAWPPSEQPEVRAAALRGMAVLPDFISHEEEAALLAELEPTLKRMRYEYDHWDNAIHGFRETERSAWRPENEAVLRRVRARAFGGDGDGEGEGEGGLVPLPHAHVLDLAAGGHIKPHVDAVRFCGAVIAGLCLASSAVMRLEHVEHKHLHFSALLQQRCLYIMSGVARYSFTHAVLGGEASAWRGERVPRRRRVAVICRSQPHTHTHTHTPTPTPTPP